jgi:uracil phosphoribosyltransferase
MIQDLYLHLQIIHYQINNCKLPIGNAISYIIVSVTYSMKTTSILVLIVSVGLMFITSLALSVHLDSVNAQQNKTLIQQQATQSMTANTTNMNIILVHGGWADGSSWGKVITILKDSGHKVIAVNLVP